MLNVSAERGGLTQSRPSRPARTLLLCHDDQPLGRPAAQRRRYPRWCCRWPRRPGRPIRRARGPNVSERPCRDAHRVQPGGPSSAMSLFVTGFLLQPTPDVPLRRGRCPIRRGKPRGNTRSLPYKFTFMISGLQTTLFQCSFRPRQIEERVTAKLVKVLSRDQIRSTKKTVLRGRSVRSVAL